MNNGDDPTMSSSETAKRWHADEERAAKELAGRDPADVPAVEIGGRVGWGPRVLMRWPSAAAYARRREFDVRWVAARMDCVVAGLYVDSEPDGSGDPERFPHVAAFVAVDRHHAAKAARKRLEDALPALSQIADAILVLSHPSVRREERKLWATDARRGEASRSGDK